jgi:L-malate glycosyltransferase
VNRDMRFGIYNECASAAGALGGSEYVITVLARALATAHSVEIVHHRGGLDASTLETFSGISLEGVRFRNVESDRPTPSHTNLPWRIWRESRQWHADLSAPYDVFVNVAHGLPPFCHAPRGVLIVLFPLFVKSRTWPWNDPPRRASDLRRQARRSYYDWEWRRRLASYESIVSISEFTREWTNRYWETDSVVVYPPVAMAEPAQIERTNTIVSVGRFATEGHLKRHADLIGAFSSLEDLRAIGWSYECIGALGSSDADREYFQTLHELSRRAGARLRPNLARAELVRAYAQAKIFVHAAGFGAPDDRPEATEHFGISTVEAMSAGCVPVVVNRGGQPEIVQHGLSGFVWNTIPELQMYIRVLASDEELRERMSSAARQRARVFSRENFIANISAVLGVQPGPIDAVDVAASSVTRRVS